MYKIIKKLRKELKLTQVEFSQRTGVGLRFIRELETGKPTIRLDKLNQVLIFLGYHLEVVKNTNNARIIAGTYTTYPTTFNKILKEEVKKRDNYQCQVCKITEQLHLELCDLPLSIHHIDGDKTNNVLKNLVTVCHRCHAKVKRKSHWENYFLDLLREKEEKEY